MTDRVFNGKTYKEYTFVPARNVESYKKQLKEQGWLVRAVKQKNGYMIYVRRG